MGCVSLDKAKTVLPALRTAACARPRAAAMATVSLDRAKTVLPALRTAACARPRLAAMAAVSLDRARTASRALPIAARAREPGVHAADEHARCSACRRAATWGAR